MKHTTNCTTACVSSAGIMGYMAVFLYELSHSILPLNVYVKNYPLGVKSLTPRGVLPVLAIVMSRPDGSGRMPDLPLH